MLFRTGLTNFNEVSMSKRMPVTGFVAGGAFPITRWIRSRGIESLTALLEVSAGAL